MLHRFFILYFWKSSIAIPMFLRISMLSVPSHFETYHIYLNCSTCFIFVSPICILHVRLYHLRIKYILSSWNLCLMFPFSFTIICKSSFNTISMFATNTVAPANLRWLRFCLSIINLGINKSYYSLKNQNMLQSALSTEKTYRCLIHHSICLIFTLCMYSWLFLYYFKMKR